MAAQHDSTATDGHTNGNNVASFTFSTTLGSGSNRAVAVDVAGLTSFGYTGETVTVDGNSASQITQVSVSPGPSLLGAYRQLPSGSGAVNVVVTFTGGNIRRGSSCAASYENVDQTTPVRAGSVVTNSGTSDEASSVAVTSQTDDCVVDCAYADNVTGFAASGSPNTERAQDNNVDRYSGLSDSAGATSVTPTWAWTGSVPWGAIGWSFAAAGGGGKPALHYRRMMAA